MDRYWTTDTTLVRITYQTVATTGCWTAWT